MSDASKILENINKLQETLENNYLKTITIMFTDLKDSTKYFEKHGDIKGRLFIERHNKMLFPIIEAHNGVIIKTIGDSIMAKFDSAYLGVRASIKMQKKLDEYNQTANEKIKIRIGIHTGKAIVENNDIFGDAVNVAARIESSTAPSRTTISQITLNDIKEYQEIKTRPLGKVKFKGKSDEIGTYSILWRTTKLKNDLENIKKEISKSNDDSSSITTVIKTKSKNAINSIPIGESIKKQKKNYIIGFLILLLLIISSTYIINRPNKILNKKIKLSKDRIQIKRYAKSFINKRIPKSENWPNSLSGFIKMVYLYFNIDLTDTNPKKPNGSWKNNTELIYSFVKNRGKLFKKGIPKAGDLIFFNNTYDKNKNKKLDDLLTTVALVIDVDKEDTIYFLYKVGNTIRIRNMNLKYPNKEDIKNKNIIKVLNSKIRKLKNNERKKNIPILSSQCFNTYGTILGLPKKNGSKTKIKDFKLFKELGNHKRKKLVKFALKFKDKPMPKSKLWTNSSSGFIKMIYLKFQVNITKSKENKNSKGKWYTITELIYNFIKENGKLYSNDNYQIGDLIFFNNTYDKDKDRKLDDILTSIGIITNISKDKTISFLINISGKIKLKYMNLNEKKNNIKINNTQKILNSIMRYHNKKKMYSYELFNSFGSIFR